jgi:hypothetical protein
MLHAEVLALQETLGISYKDASHRLYIAELEKLKVADEKYKAFKNLGSRLKKFVDSINEDFVQVPGDDPDPDAATTTEAHTPAEDHITAEDTPAE